MDAGKALDQQRIDEVVFAYSDVSYDYIDEHRQAVEARGVAFNTFDVDASMLETSKPVIAVTAVRTGCGKSQVSRRIAAILGQLGKKTVAVYASEDRLGLLSVFAVPLGLEEAPWICLVCGLACPDDMTCVDDPADDWMPSFAPDGSRLVFRSERDGGGIYLVNLLGGPARKLVDHKGPVTLCGLKLGGEGFAPLVARTEDDHRLDRFTTLLVFDANDSNLEHAGTRRHHGLDLVGKYIKAGNEDHIFFAIN